MRFSWLTVPILAMGFAITFVMTLAHAQSSNSPAAVGFGPVAVIVKIPLPASIPRATLPERFKANIGVYKNLPGLVRKYFTVTDDNKFGGIYLYESRAAAEAHFNPEWKAGVVKNYGVPAELEYFDAPVRIVGTHAKPLEDL